LLRVEIFDIDVVLVVVECVLNKQKGRATDFQSRQERVSYNKGLISSQYVYVVFLSSFLFLVFFESLFLTYVYLEDDYYAASEGMRSYSFSARHSILKTRS